MVVITRRHVVASMIVVLLVGTLLWYVLYPHLIEEKRDPQFAAIGDALGAYQEDFGKLPSSFLEVNALLDLRTRSDCEITRLSGDTYRVVVRKAGKPERTLEVRYAINSAGIMEKFDVRHLFNGVSH